MDRAAADDRIPILPPPPQRWTYVRKAMVVTAVRRGVPVEKVCELYRLSTDELVSWEVNFDRYGVYGLMAKRIPRRAPHRQLPRSGA